MAWFGDKKDKKEIVINDLPLGELTPLPTDLSKVPVVDALSLVYFVWTLYKLNIITRIQVKDFLDIIHKCEWPQDVVKYLTDEVKKL